MPRYKKKITSLMNYEEFKSKIDGLPIARQAFLTILFFSGCRVSEALALTWRNINCTITTIYIEFDRLKGSKKTDPIPLPNNDALKWLGLYSKKVPDNKIFTFSYKTAYRIVKRIWPELYPHYFRMNRITKISEELGDSFVYSFVGITANAIDHYRGKVDIRRVGKALQAELSSNPAKK